MKCFSWQVFVRGVLFLLIIATLSWRLPPASALAAEPEVQQAADSPALPQDIGKVVFRIAGKGDKEVFIVGQSHRSAISGANGIHTVKAQAELYRIGEWLIQNESIRLLLPEGFFKRSPAVAVRQVSLGNSDPAKGAWLDDQTLEEKLADTRVFVNADMLLKANYNIQLHQVEEPEIYQAVGKYLRQVEETAGPVDLSLDYLQEVRSAAMLQNIPDAIETEFHLGNIDSRRAMFTIGMAHIDEIVRFLKEGRIDIKAPHVSSAAYRDVDAVLKLAEEGYGVTVILPRALVDDHDILQLANLGSI